MFHKLQIYITENCCFYPLINYVSNIDINTNINVVNSPKIISPCMSYMLLNINTIYLGKGKKGDYRLGLTITDFIAKKTAGSDILLVFF